MPQPKSDGKKSLITMRADDYSQWYLDVVREGDLADHSAVRGCMVIKPHGYAIWERMQSELDQRFKATGHVNAYFPLFIPLSFFAKEEAHASGFAKECAVVTHHRLKAENGTVIVDPNSALEEPLVVRPTSETVIWNQYKSWIHSYRDLPLLINQWANVVRWEMRTRLFLRTTEFLWQEGHTAHATEQEAREETSRMLDVYADFAEKVMAVPVIRGHKTPAERFAGAIDTQCVEGMMQDGKAVQMGTSHYLGQAFAKANDVQFLNKEGKLEYPFATSWGVSTRLIGAMIMVHSDDNGLILPPKLAPVHVVIVPIYKTEEERAQTVEEARRVADELKNMQVIVKVDDREGMSPGAKYSEWEAKGVPIRIEIGPRDLEANQLSIVKRFIIERAGEDADALRKRKKSAMSRNDAIEEVPKMLEAMQAELFERARLMRDARTRVIDSIEEFETFFQEEGGGFAWVHWAGDEKDEEEMAKRYETTIRCIPFEDQAPVEARGEGKCILTGRPSMRRVIMAKAY